MDNKQILFFESIKASIPDYQNLAHSVAQALEISINEAYKKIRGSSKLNLDQIVKLSDAFRIPFSYKPNQLPTVTFDYMSIDNQSPNMLKYLHNLHETLKQIAKSKQKHITVTTDDIPIFHLFKYPELTAFKLYYWSESISNSQNTFSLALLTDEIKQIGTEINQLYLEMPSTEIWAKDTMQGTIEQIRYAFEAGHIANKQLAELLVEQLRYCLTDINMYAVSSKKTIDPSHAFNWYHCDVLGNICYFVELKENTQCFNRFNTFNYLKTDDPLYCQQTKNWINGLIQKSISFSGQGEKHRNKYLYNAYADCDNLIKEINA